MENYWKKENPEYIELECRMDTRQHRIDSGIITNDRTLKYAKRDIKRWKEALLKTRQYLD